MTRGSEKTWKNGM